MEDVCHLNCVFVNWLCQVKYFEALLQQRFNKWRWFKLSPGCSSNIEDRFLFVLHALDISRREIKRLNTETIYRVRVVALSASWEVSKRSNFERRFRLPGSSMIPTWNVFELIAIDHFQTLNANFKWGQSGGGGGILNLWDFWRKDNQCRDKTGKQAGWLATVDVKLAQNLIKDDLETLGN